jgi:3-deoxy-D-manno-octulosonic-acid transferase
MLRERYGYAVMVSTTTKTGQQVARQSKVNQGIPVFYFPFDWGWAVQRAFGWVQPALVILTETELWPQCLATAQQRGVPVWVVNARVSDKSFQRYQLIKQWVMAPMLRGVSRGFAQSENDAKRLITLGFPAERCEVLGNLKFDWNQTLEAVHDDKAQTLRNQCAPWFEASEPRVLVIASTHPQEEALLLPLALAWQQAIDELKVVWAPRHPERSGEVATLLAQAGQAIVLQSELASHRNADAILPNHLIVDSVGQLKAWYRCATVAVVGGSFLPAYGGHNILEPLIAKTPVVFGASMRNFALISELVVNAKAGVQAETLEQLDDTVKTWLINEPQRQLVIKNAQQLLEQYKGNTDKLARAIHQFLA